MSILKLAPACKDYLWGGRKLIDDYHKRFDGARLAETWELSCHEDGLSVIAEGAHAGETLKAYLARHPAALGKAGSRFDDFPLLIKLIDAERDLSVQVHPGDAYARAHEGQSGKTEMWYVLSAAPGAYLYCGFARPLTREEFRARIEAGTLPEVLRRVNVKAGDVVFIPAGTIHAICRGIVVAEVQQSSNVTYRVCDYGRLGADGRPRALHIAQALEVTDLSAGAKQPDFGGHLARCAYFTADLLRAPEETACGAESFLSLLMLDGEGTVECGGERVPTRRGESLFLSAGSGTVRLTGTLRALCTRAGVV